MEVFRESFRADVRYQLSLTSLKEEIGAANSEQTLATSRRYDLTAPKTSFRPAGSMCTDILL